MNWKTKIQLLDLGRSERIEITCKSCGYHWYVFNNSALLIRFRQFYLDEYEASLCCRQRGCIGKVRIALSNETETEGFQGGLA